MLQGVSYLMAKLEPNKKDQWSRPMRESMATWLRGQDNITYTEKVRTFVLLGPRCWLVLVSLSCRHEAGRQARPGFMQVAVFVGLAGLGLWLDKASLTQQHRPPPCLCCVAAAQGMAWMDNWGNFRYVASQAFIGLLHNKLYPSDSKRATAYACFARKQARIMLGETGRSYVVGAQRHCLAKRVWLKSTWPPAVTPQKPPLHASVGCVGAFHC